MTRRWAWWTGAALVAVALLAFGAWRLAREIPDRLREAEAAIREEAARKGLSVSFRNLKFHFLYLQISLEQLQVRDALAGLPIGGAERVDLSLSPYRFLSGLSPVSRVRIRNFVFRAEERNRPLFERLSRGEGGKEPLPEIVFLGGSVALGPFGPLKRWEAKVPELRIREVRFFGTRVTGGAERISGEIEIPGAGEGRWPFDSMEADLLSREGVVRVRKFRAAGRSASLKLSGLLDVRRSSGDLKASGELDLARWMAMGAPGGPWLAKVVKEGNVAFTASVAGTVAAPSGSARLVLTDGRFQGDATAQGEIALAATRSRLRVDSLRGKAWGGNLSGSGVYDLSAGRGEGKVALAKAVLSGAPWKEWGFSWRPSGAVDVEASLAGNLDAVRGTVSVRNPAGLERIDGTAALPDRIGLPLSVSVSGSADRAGEVQLADFRLRAGNAELSARGNVSVRDRRVLLAGGLTVPQGGVGDYGWKYPVSWKEVKGEWEAEGPAERPRMRGRLEANGLSVRALPPVNVVAKWDGDPAEAIHFAADLPTSLAEVTATGTVTGPLASAPTRTEVTVAARNVDLSAGSPWLTAIYASLGKDPSPAIALVAGLSGTGSADLRVSAAADAVSVAGAMKFPEVRLKGVAARSLLLTGEFGHRGGVASWEARAEGKFGEGPFRLSGTGREGSVDVTGTVDRLDLGPTIALADRGLGEAVRGSARVRFGARYGAKGWEVPQFSAVVPALGYGALSWEGVSAEGSLDGTGGKAVLSSASPKMRLSGSVVREEGWPVAFSVRADDVPTAFLLAAAGRKGPPSGGKWKAEADGIARLAALVDGKTPVSDCFPSLQFSLSAAAPSVQGTTFASLEAWGKKEGSGLAGEVRTRLPDTRLSWSVALREPFGFRVEGPFSVGTPGNGAGKEEGKARFALSGRAEVVGALRALEKSTGSVEVRQFHYRDGGMEVSGKDLSAVLSADGIRWAGGTVVAAGNPLHVSGRVSWKGDLDARLDGKMPASAIRLVTDVFDRLDGAMRLEARITGKWNDPTVVGTGRLDGGVFSFRGYAQLFEAMTAEAVISREKIIFEHFEGRSGGGYIDGWGELPLKFDAGQRMFFSVDFLDMRFPYPDDLRPVLQGHAELLGPIDDLLVTGEVEVQSALYSKTVRLEKTILEVRRRLADVTARKAASDFRVRLDIEGVADGTIRIKNNIADAVGQGDFKVVGDTGRVIVLGTFDILEGKAEFRGNKYDVTRLTVDFQDPRRNNPRIDARAETRKGDVTVAVAVTGTLEKYEVDFSSDPPLGKNDIVSLLTVGVKTSELAGAERAVGAGAGGSVLLGSYTGKVEEGFRGIAGLDRFAIEPSFSTTTKSFEPKFVVGKSFGDRFNVSVSTTVGTGAESSASAEMKLLENVFVEGGYQSSTTSKQGDLGADIKFRYRYRQFKDIFRGRE